MSSGFANLAAAALAALLLSACTTGGDAPSPRAQTSPQLQSLDLPLAFEPIVGIPEERAAVLAEELGASAVARGLDVVPRDDEEAQLRIKGYVTASGSSNETTVTYVWDIFGADGTRTHRIQGSQSVGAALPDPWQAVTDDALRKIARRTVDELANWLAGAPAPATASPAVTRYAASQALAADASPSVGPLDPRFAVSVQPVRVKAGDGASSLSAALARELATAGASVAPGGADYRISGEATVGPAHDGEQAVAIIWSVSDTAGTVLGTVRQIRKVPAGSLDAAWGPAADRAAAAAAPGILALIEDP